jgi:hypothetical protein
MIAECDQKKGGLASGHEYEALESLLRGDCLRTGLPRISIGTLALYKAVKGVKRAHQK